MRLAKVTFVLGALFVMMAPARADAWFGLLDRLSGPGKFYGELFEVRLVCFGPTFPFTKNLEAALATANLRLLEDALRPPGVQPPAPQQPLLGQRALMTFVEVLRDTQKQFRVLSDDDIETLDDNVRSLQEMDFATFRTQLMRLATPTNQTRGGVVPPFRLTGDVADAIRRAQRFIEQVDRANVSINSTGVAASLCTPSKTRRFGVEMAVDLYQANSNPRFANDHSIRLILALPSLTYRVSTDPSYDILDIGTGIGGYWFSSRGFQSFNGLVLQPIHFDLHGPTAWVNSNDLARLLSLVTFRFGFTRFPAGFKAGAFGPGSEAIPAEWTRTAAFYFNITPLLSRPKHIIGIR